MREGEIMGFGEGGREGEDEEEGLCHLGIRGDLFGEAVLCEEEKEGIK